MDSLLIAKEIIDAQARTKEHEQKASERRQKIHKYNSFLAGTLGQNKRRLSFADEVNNACLAIAPNFVGTESVPGKAKETRRKIKRELSRKRRPSFSDQIQVAQSAILDYQKKIPSRPTQNEQVRVCYTQWTTQVVK